jgi:formylglycine-generating enzyme required for sulfatase activity
VDWNDAKAYLAWLSQKTGKTYRLPTESEWEYVARASTTSAYPWGRFIEKDRANCSGCTSERHNDTIEVGSFKPNDFGVYDMAGNAAEWVEDCWSEGYRGAPDDGSASSNKGCPARYFGAEHSTTTPNMCGPRRDSNMIMTSVTPQTDSALFAKNRC